MKKILFIIAISLLLSCTKQDNSIPFYIQIDDIILDEDISENINDAWVYVNDNPIGVYELPAKFPVLSDGKKEIKIKAGIKKNGISATRVFYPFYTTFSDSIFFIQDSIYTITPIIKYSENIDWNKVFVEDFENPGMQFENSGQNINSMQDTSRGNGKCGHIKLDTILPNCETRTTILDLPKGSEIYLEMDYKSENTSFIVGLQSNYINDTVKDPVIDIFPKTEWNKIYIDLSSVVSSKINAASFQIYIYAEKPSSSISRSLYIDNFRIIYL
ncbi:MAG: hypothetical protein VX370_02525 [Bacteroidota bacterium]|nr:hypothetical protein [Bacteroidota bacterium]